MPCRFLQNSGDRREIYAVVERDGGRYGYGPLIDDVIARLGVDGRALYEASDAEIAVPGHDDPEGNPLFINHFGDNWAIGDLSGWRAIDPRHYRFKAWLSFHT